MKILKNSWRRFVRFSSQRIYFERWQYYPLWLAVVFMLFVLIFY